MKYEVGYCTTQILHSFSFKVESDRLCVAKVLPMFKPILCSVEISLRNNTFCQSSVRCKLRFQLRNHGSILKCLSKDLFSCACKRDCGYERIAVQKELDCPIKLVNSGINLGDEIFHVFYRPR